MPYSRRRTGSGWKPSSLTMSADIVRLDGFHPDPVRRLEYGIEPVRRRLVRSHQPKVARLGVEAHQVSKKRAHDPSRFPKRGAGGWYRELVVVEIRQLQLALERSAVGVRVRTHAAAAVRGKGAQIAPQAA